MVNFILAAAALSGQAVRGLADNVPDKPYTDARADLTTLEDNVHRAVQLIREALDLASISVEKAVDAASDKAFESAANVGVNIASPPAAQTLSQNSFSWGGYLQAIGILCLLLAILWFGVWLLRRYGRFNFLPKPGALPKGALVMEAQMPLGPRKGLMVVRFLNKRLLLGVTEQQITLLTEENAQNERREGHFQEYMADAGKSASRHFADSDSS